MYGQVCIMHLCLFVYVSVMLSFLHCKKNLLCVVLRVDISEQHSAGGATMIIIIVVKV